MRVPEHDDVAGMTSKDGLGRCSRELVPVRDVDAHAAECDGPLAGKHRIVRVVDVAEHSDYARDSPKRLEHRAATDVARVNDQLHSLENRGDLRTPQAVGVGDHADEMNASHIITARRRS